MNHDFVPGDLYRRQVASARMWAIIAMIALVGMTAVYALAITEVKALEHQRDLMSAKVEALEEVLAR